LCDINVVFSVDSLLQLWLNLSKTGQDARVACCDLTTLEDSMQRLCSLTNRDYNRCSLRYKDALASEIGDIFRSSLRGLLGSLSQRALHYTLPFVRNGSFT
jgi:hypothetical protein